MKLNLDIVKNLLKDDHDLPDRFVPYGKTYLSTTENIAGTMSCCNLADKDVLCVQGSGDHPLNAYFNGANHVTAFDVNPISYAQSELKFMAAKTLCYQEFIEFFIREFNKTFNTHTFKKLIPALSDDVAAYYDYLLTHFKPEEILAKTIHNFNPSLHKMEAMNAYMGEDNYKNLQNIIQNKKIEYIKCDLADLPNTLSDNYDAIFLSNISDEIENIFPINTLKTYKAFIHVLSHHLKSHGIIQCGYIYSHYNSLPLFANKLLNKNVFRDGEFKTCDIESYLSYAACDEVVLYQKKK